MFPNFSQPRQAHRRFTKILKRLMKHNQDQEYHTYLNILKFKELKKVIVQGNKNSLFSNKDSDQISNISDESKNQSFEDVLDVFLKPAQLTNIPEQQEDKSIIFLRKTKPQKEKASLKKEESIWISSDDSKIEVNQKVISKFVQQQKDQKEKLRKLLPKNIKRQIIEN